TPTTPDSPAPAPSRNGTAGPGPLRAAHTANFPALLRQLGASLLVTTYQAGKLRGAMTACAKRLGPIGPALLTAAALPGGASPPPPPGGVPAIRWRKAQLT